MRAILTYHAIDATGSVISVTPEDFAAHVSWAASGAVQVVSVEELLAFPDSVNAVALTFDDALGLGRHRSGTPTGGPRSRGDGVRRQ
ncbi:MAG: hypothetical protein IPO52_15740 [Gemmatimonadetes bacterium]|nr:hypothetical protein [Gemmatimonadota bacterium]